MTIPRKVQYNEALDSVNAILCQKIVKITQPLAWACWNYYVNFFSSEGMFLQILGRNYFWSGRVPSCKFVGENITTHLLFFDWDFVREKLEKKDMYIANGKKSRYTKKYTLCIAFAWRGILGMKLIIHVMRKSSCIYF